MEKETQLLPYQKNSALLFEHFVHLPYPVFLDSAGCDRYDIISANPVQCIETDVFHKVKNAVTCLEKNNPYDLPFTIGAIGYLGYDIARTCETLPIIAKKDITIPDSFIGIYDWSIVTDHLRKKTYLTATTEKAKKIIALLNKKTHSDKNFNIIKSFESNFTKKTYEDAFNIIKKNILDGNCYQINLAQRFSGRYQGNPWHAYKILRAKNPAPFSAYIQLNNNAILSMSPERFLKANDSQVITKPIKGTSKRFQDPIEDQQSAKNLLLSEKDRAENIMIVDLLRNDLSKSCQAGSISVPTLCALESFANVHHLVSTIQGTLSHTMTPMDLLQHCFPGGSITGAPKIAAMKMIEALEPHRRSLYCGTIFYLDANEQLDSNIAIRSIICDENRIHCYAGSGIVYDSDSDKEYEECFSKVGNILKILTAL